MKVLAINGSPRREGNTAALLAAALEELEDQGIETELLHLKGPLSGCISCGKCWEKKDRRCALDNDMINDCIEKMVGADGIILGSPTYFADLTPELKALIDRAGFVAKANGDLFKRKVGAAVVAVRRAGAIHVFDSINHFYLISQMIIAGSNYWNIGLGLHEKEVEGDSEGMATMKTLGENMAWLLERINESDE
ncbi:MAG TPA: flavodoxin family protein [Methanothrix sp.]|nr:flavodoxin family protein [Methanothrix sp.]HPT19435.1 flavodoxin family protein [Methanothrix sp.]